MALRLPILAIRHLRHIATNASRWKNVAFSNKYLLFTNIGISISLSATGDILEQNFEIWKKDLDKYSSKRTLHMGMSGMTVGVVCHYWYKLLDRWLVGRSAKILIKKIILDQLVCSPLYISMFFVTLAFVDNQDMSEMKENFGGKFFKLYLAEWIVWPPAQVVNFYFLPTKYRVLYDNTISLGYDVFFSSTMYAKDAEES